MAMTKTEGPRIDVENGEWKVFTERIGWSDEIRICVGQCSGRDFFNATIGKDGRLALTLTN